ncbi:MAG: ATP-binding protein [Trueperaceae bacterium]
MIVPRAITPRIQGALQDTPVILITGSRQVGKSTLVKAVSSASYITFDDLAVLERAQRDPIGFVAGLPEKVILDEIQRVPELMLPIKAAVDKNRKPGRFLLTGSANVLMLPKVADSLAGRIAIFTLSPLSQLELEGSPVTFMDRLFYAQPTVTTSTPTNYIERILKGGYPEVLTRSSSRRDAWFEDYVRTFVQRDVRELANITGLIDFARLLRLLALRTSTVLNGADVARDAAINAMTFKRYFALLELSYLLFSLPAWSFNPHKRLVKAPKLHLSDTGLAANLMNLHQDRLEQDRDQLGALLETFVATELYKQQAWSDTRGQFYHYRVHGGSEVDLVFEDQRGRLVGIEVKATATPREDDFRGIKAFQQNTGKRFFRGLVLHTGEHILPFSDKLWAMPISTLWRNDT